MSRKTLHVAMFLIATISSTALATTVTTLEFADWDADLLSQDGGSQFFENAAGDLDVTVTSFGDFDAPPTYFATIDGGDDAIRSHHDPSAERSCHGFQFLFSEPVDALIETVSLDGQEEYKFTTTGDLRYSNESGASPAIDESMSGMLHLDGTAFGRDPVVGSSDGLTFISAPDGGAYPITVSYCADPTLGASNVTKYGSIRVAAVSATVTPLPEPQSVTLFAIGLLSLMAMRRRR